MFVLLFSPTEHEHNMGKGKKLSTNPKAADARAAKAEKKQDVASASAKAKEDAYWDAHANPVAKRDVKREAAAAKAAEAAKKKVCDVAQSILYIRCRSFDVSCTEGRTRMLFSTTVLSHCGWPTSSVLVCRQSWQS